MQIFSPVAILFWLLIGLLAAMPMLWFVLKLTPKLQIKILGRSLIVAALIYVIFAIIWSNHQWFWVELLGVLIYGLFYALALKRGIFWLGLGWLLHPLWDLLLHLYGPGYHVVPQWYAWACLSFDTAVFGFILVVLYNRKLLNHLQAHKNGHTKM